MTDTPQLNRRTVLQATGATVLGTALAGCTGVLGSDGDEGGDVVLDPPENYERRKDLDLPYPTYKETVPSVSVQAPLHDQEMDTTEFVGDRHTMLTFIYTSCTTVCPGLTNALRHVQADSISEGYAEEMAFMPTTFDPEYDTAEVLRSYGKDMGVDFAADNWYFLRPETPDDAKDVVTDTFGVAFEQGDSNGSSDGMDDMGDDHARHFTHLSLILLVNEDGFVERAYNGQPPSPDTAIEDASTLVERW